ncbi:hypothetical protein Q8A73_010353 [Channa argus]|nr:hypothetical protein Q8A73_010353 [Channa argus]
MTALMWMLTWLLQVLSVMSELPKPEKLKITSKDFIHILTWEPGQGTPIEVYYNVTITGDRDSSSKSVAGCQGVQNPLVCNLTEAFKDQTQNYFTHVTAILGQQTSLPANLKGFRPMSDTELDTPLLTVTPCGRNLCVELQPPVEQLREIYEKITYNLQIQSKGEDRVQVKGIRSLEKQIVEHLAPGRQYCVSVCFADTLESRQSNYSQPVCAFTTGIIPADPWISAGLCVLVIFLVVVGVFLFSTGFICLKRRPLPLVLTSIHHTDEALVNALFSTSLSSLVNVKPAQPSTGEKRLKQSSSDESDEESETERISESYRLWGGANRLPPSSSSSSSLPALLSPEPVPQLFISSDQTPDSAEKHSSVVPNNLLNKDTDSSSSSRQSVATIKQKEEKEQIEEAMVLGDGGSQNVNLLTLTFGRQEEEEEEQDLKPNVAKVETEAPYSSEECRIVSVQPSQIGESRKIIVETSSCSTDEEEEDEEEEEEEEEEEDSGYMKRPFVCSNPKPSRVIATHNTIHGGMMGLWLLLLLHLHLGNAPRTEDVCVSLPAPSSISISSFNMEHTLSFLPGPGTPPETHFTVQIIHHRKNSWRPVTGCLELRAGQTCNLTRVFKDLYDHYRARVQAYTPTQTSNWTLSAWFLPLSDTVLGPPDVTVSGCGNCLTVQLRVPTKELPQNLQLKDLYKRIIFRVQRTRDGAQFTLTLDYEEENVITYLQSGVEYCVSVSATGSVSSNPVYSKPYCAFTSPPSTKSSCTLYVVLGLAGVFCMLGFLIIGLLIYGGQMSLKLPIHLTRRLSYILIQGQKRGSTRPELSGPFSASQLHETGSASCLLTAHSPVEAVNSSEVEEEDCGLVPN